jgi:uncharacterized phage protein (TIGR01671 family)
MREIKFRAWDKKGKRMCLVGGIVFEKGQIVEVDADEGDKLTNFILMQYTGLKDKNNKEIYEGDIVIYQNAYDDTTAVEIEYDPSEAYFTVPTRYSADMEIIGNIYENPLGTEKGV